VPARGRGACQWTCQSSTLPPTPTGADERPERWWKGPVTWFNPLPALITRRSQVQILPPPPIAARRPRSGTWAFVVRSAFYRVRLPGRRQCWCGPAVDAGCAVADVLDASEQPERRARMPVGASAGQPSARPGYSVSSQSPWSQRRACCCSDPCVEGSQSQAINPAESMTSTRLRVDARPQVWDI
jgi:hypothetical protein